MGNYESKFKAMVEQAEGKEFMELRDRFAMAALQGLLAGGYDGEYNHAARHAYVYADEMLTVREQ